MAECKGPQSSHIKGLMPSLWKIMIKDFKNPVLLANKTLNLITELLYQC